MKAGLAQIVGKRIMAVVVTSSERQPHQQVFLVFTDGSQFEFYGSSFNCCSGLDNAGDLFRYVASGRGKVENIYGVLPGGVRREERIRGEMREEARAAPPPESMEQLMTRDLRAWRMAKAWIEWAKDA